MNRLALTGVICLLASAAGGAVTASLTPAEVQDPALHPYAAATLTLTNQAPAAVESVMLRPVGGGLGVRYSLAAAPGQTARRDVALPAIWRVQQYRVEARDADGAVIGTATAEITWAAQAVATGAFIDDAYIPWRQMRPPWPASTRRRVMLGLCLFTAAAGGVLLVRRRWLRPVLVTLLAGGATALVASGAGWPASIQADAHVLVLYGQGAPVVESFTVLSARRTGVATLAAVGIPHPVYPDRAAAAADDAVVDPARRAIDLTVRPGLSRIVRPSERAYRPTPGTTGTVRTGPTGEATVQARMDHRRALLVTADQVWPVPSGSGELEWTVRGEAARKVWSVLAEPGRWGLDRRLVRLLDYWRTKHQRGEGVYLLNFTEAPGEIRLEVLRLVEGGR